MKDIFNGCVDSVPLPEPHLCPAGDYKLSAIEEHSDYIADVTGGFNPVTCKGRCKTVLHNLNCAVRKPVFGVSNQVMINQPT